MVVNGHAEVHEGEDRGENGQHKRRQQLACNRACAYLELARVLGRYVPFRSLDLHVDLSEICWKGANLLKLACCFRLGSLQINAHVHTVDVTL